MTGIVPNSLPITFGCLHLLTLAKQHIAKVVMGIGILRIDSQSLAKTLGRLAGPALR